MTEFTSATGHRPVREADVAKVSAAVNTELRMQQHSGMDGLDIALGTISALRIFVLYNVGPEGLREELAALAAELTRTDG